MHTTRTALAAVALIAAAAPTNAQTDYSFHQLTEFGFGTGIFEVSIAAEAKNRIAFRTTGSLDGPNDGGNFEVFFYDIPSDTFSRLVDIPAGQVREDPRLSGDGRFVVFNTSIDLTGDNPDGNFEIFRIDRQTGDIVQVTDSTLGLRDFPDINGDGSLVVYAEGNDIFLWDASDNSTTNLTNNPTNLRCDAPQISNDGRFVSFYSLAGLDPTDSGNGLQVIDRQAGTITRVARPAIDNEDNDPFTMEMAPDGSAVFFESDQQLGTLRDLYRYDIPTDTIERVTTGTPLISDAQLSTDASRRYVSVANDGTLAYRSEQPDLDPGVDNSDGANLDLFIATLPQPIPGDTDGDGGVHGNDLLTVLDNFGTNDGSATTADGDVAPFPGGDGNVNAADLLLVLRNFGTTADPEPNS